MVRWFYKGEMSTLTSKTCAVEHQSFALRRMDVRMWLSLYVSGEMQSPAWFDALRYFSFSFALEDGDIGLTTSPANLHRHCPPAYRGLRFHFANLSRSYLP